jgi:phosphoglycolate phosphatase-like HAD superfamily hydrolase
LAVASNKPSDYTRSIVAHLKIDRFFSEVSGPGGAIQPKPDPSMLTSLMYKLEVTAAQTLYVGDMPLDAETAQNAGVSVALIPSGGGTFEELKTAKPDYLLQKISDLPGVLAVD